MNRLMRWMSGLGIMFLVLMLAACQRGTAGSDATPVPPVATEGQDAAVAPNTGTPIPLSPIPMSGNAVLTGRLIDATTGAPMPNIGVQVAPIYWTSTDPATREGQFILNTSGAPFATSDGDGRFRFDTLADGDWVIVVGDVTMNYMVVEDEAGNGRAWSVSAAAPTDVGDIPVAWQSGAP